jgi:hypothetical protein
VSLSFILALIVLLVSAATALGLVAGEHLLWWLIAGLALAGLLSGWTPAFWPGRKP